VSGAKPTAVGFVMAGGRSDRMGFDKALLPRGSGTLLDHAVARLRRACGDVRILCGPERRYEGRGADVVVDAIPGAGPLGGVYSGLRCLEDVPGLFLAVDLPDVPEELLAHLLTLAPGWDAVVPVHAAGEEPLCAVYAPACAEPIRRRLEAGQLKMTSFWSDLRVRRVGDTEIAAFGDPLRLFRNLNTPGDLRPA
jgi:molybdopterin-guanine dinucleotide biosynthesis protein A